MTVTEQGPVNLEGSELDALDAWWRAANYLSVGQIYLMANPLLTERLAAPWLPGALWLSRPAPASW